MISSQSKVISRIVDPYIEWHHVARFVEDDVVWLGIVNFYLGLW